MLLSTQVFYATYAHFAFTAYTSHWDVCTRQASRKLWAASLVSCLPMMGRPRTCVWDHSDHLVAEPRRLNSTPTNPNTQISKHNIHRLQWWGGGKLLIWPWSQNGHGAKSPHRPRPVPPPPQKNKWQMLLSTQVFYATYAHFAFTAYTSHWDVCTRQASRKLWAASLVSCLPMMGRPRTCVWDHSDHLVAEPRRLNSTPTNLNTHLNMQMFPSSFAPFACFSNREERIQYCLPSCSAP